jgi:hypothetical protein
VPTLTAKSIRSLGGVPTRIEFSPPYPFKAGSRSLAVVLSQNYVTILDLDNADRTEISVPLCPQSTGCTYSPDQILFDPANAAIYVRAGNAMDIFQIALTDLGAAPTDGSNDFLASLSMLSVGANPASMVLYGSGPDTRLAVLAPSNKRLVIIDPSTSHTLSIATSIPANVMVPFTAVGAAGAPQKQAMLVDTINGSTSVLFADLEEVETISGLAIKDAPLRAAASDVQPLVDQGIAVLVLGKYGAISAFTVVEFGMTSKFVEITVEQHLWQPLLRNAQSKPAVGRGLWDQAQLSQPGGARGESRPGFQRGLAGPDHHQHSGARAGQRRRAPLPRGRAKRSEPNRQPDLPRCGQSRPAHRAHRLRIPILELP